MVAASGVRTDEGRERRMGHALLAVYMCSSRYGSPYQCSAFQYYAGWVIVPIALVVALFGHQGYRYRRRRRSSFSNDDGVQGQELLASSRRDVGLPPEGYGPPGYGPPAAGFAPGVAAPAPGPATCPPCGRLVAGLVPGPRPTRPAAVLVRRHLGPLPAARGFPGTNTGTVRTTHPGGGRPPPERDGWRVPRYRGFRGRPTARSCRTTRSGPPGPDGR